MQSTQDWPSLEQLQGLGWNALQEQLAANQTHLIELLKQQSDQILSKVYNDQMHTFDYLINGIIQHDIYHLGQIGLVMSMLKHP
ncbi:DinB family protein [Siphonobacter sp. SORGH_AS_0500]|uniref:DinB family protein n=1 Tax=Siphonobacter sp. SORGH_AS_0500 TaxID=1864824 RepID=UPI0028618041|nr:DinB family protein [Siphonobacter sp. SORGH_AS_0500]MDR6194940.1 putative damage-inducible protein DinB [Siphonobacter sp. SORGH_AS_0500]